MNEEKKMKLELRKEGREDSKKRVEKRVRESGEEGRGEELEQ